MHQNALMSSSPALLAALIPVNADLWSPWWEGAAFWPQLREALLGPEGFLGLLCLVLAVSALHLWRRNQRLQRRAELAVEGLCRENEGKLRSRNELGSVLAAMTSLVLELQQDGTVRRVIPTRFRFKNSPRESLEGSSLREFMPPYAWERCHDILGRVIEQRGAEEFEAPLEFDGEPASYVVAVSPLRHDRVLLVARDISERKRFEEELARQVFLDPMTGLPNRALLMDRLRRAMARTRRREGLQYAVLYVDLDRFRLINESLGHALGDALIQEAGKRISGCLRKVDTVSRFVGDEFVLLLDDILDREEALGVADRVRELLEQPFCIDDNEVYITASIGIAYSSPHYETPDEIVVDALSAMQWTSARCSGGCKVFHTAMHDRARVYLQLETDMRKAVQELSCGCDAPDTVPQFSVHYQPIVTLGSGRAVGLEALLRWQHPLRGGISPADFIPIAEETGLILPLGQWVLEQAVERLAQLNQHRRNGAALSMSVNISARQLQQDVLAQTVGQALRRRDVPGERLHLELTESMVMHSPAEAGSVMQELKQLGVLLAIDDFGTGYSSLSHLYQFPFDVLKIDRSFVSRVDHYKGKHYQIIEAIVAMAHSMQMQVVAEGVEDALQRRQLQELGCGLAQGYHFARPMDASALETWLAESGGGSLRLPVAPPTAAPPA